MRLSRIAILLSVFVLCGCTQLKSVNSLPYRSSAPVVNPQVLQTGGLPTNWTRFTPNTYSESYGGIVAGPDKNMWFLDWLGPGLVKMSMSGATTEYPLPTDPVTLDPEFIVNGPNNRFFILTQPGAVEFANLNGLIKWYKLPTDSGFAGIAAGQDGNAWVTADNNIYKVSPTGSIQQYAYPGGRGSNDPITVGPGNLLWFGDNISNSIGSIDPSNGTILEYAIGRSCGNVSSIVSPPDGNLWFNCPAFNPGFVVRMTPAGATTFYQIPEPNTLPLAATVGPGGWPFFIVDPSQGVQPGLLRVNTANGVMTMLPAPYGSDFFDGVAKGPDGNLWISGNGHIDVYIKDILGVKPGTLNFVSTNLTASIVGKETQNPTLTASSSNIGIATVTAGRSRNTFKVTSVGVGYCMITVQDSIGNSFNVSVTVQ